MRPVRISVVDVFSYWQMGNCLSLRLTFALPLHFHSFHSIFVFSFFLLHFYYHYYLLQLTMAMVCMCLCVDRLYLFIVVFSCQKDSFSPQHNENMCKHD